MRNRGVTTVVALAMLVATACSNAGTPTNSPTTAATPTAAATTAAPTTAAATATATATAIATATATATAIATATATASPPPTASPSPTPSPAATVSAECQAPALVTRTAGKLTIGTDNPAFPPWWGGDVAKQYPGEPAGTEEWQADGGDPYSGEGYESAVAYAVAERLGFGPDAVVWTPVPYLQSFAPGPKAFDFYLAQISYNADRAKTADLSDAYYEVNQAIVALPDNPIAKVTTLAGLKEFVLGAPVGTTSFKVITDVIQPTKDPQVYDDLDKALNGLKAKQIDGVVLDLPSAFYMRDVQLEGKGVIVGQVKTAEQEHFSLVLPKGSTMTACVNEAIAAIRADGTLQSIFDDWLGDKADAPIFQ